MNFKYRYEVCGILDILHMAKRIRHWAYSRCHIGEFQKKNWKIQNFLLLYRYGVWVVFVAATFRVAKIRRLKTCDYILHASRFTPSRFFSRFTSSRFTLHGFIHASRFTLSRFFSRFTPSRFTQKNLPYRKCLIHGFSTALLLHCSTALLLYRYGVCVSVALSVVYFVFSDSGERTRRKDKDNKL